jgi:hypothetical protein
MDTITIKAQNLLNAYFIILGTLNYEEKKQVIDFLQTSIDNEQKTITTDNFIPEKTAEEIIAELRNSRAFGNTRQIESFD